MGIRKKHDRAYLGKVTYITGQMLGQRGRGVSYPAQLSCLIILPNYPAYPVCPAYPAYPAYPAPSLPLGAKGRVICPQVHPKKLSFFGHRCRWNYVLFSYCN